MKKSVAIAVVCLVVGFFVGKSQGPEKIETTETVDRQTKLISELQKRIESLTQENLKENVKTVVVEKPDGTKVTTRTRNTEKSTNTTKLSKEKESNTIDEVVRTEKKVVTTFSSNHNAIGVRPSYKLFDRFEAEAYVKAGMKCFIFECYVEGSYGFIAEEVRAIAGIEYRF